MVQIKSIIDIFKILNMSNCQDCNEKTCMAFAAAVIQKRKQLKECKYLDLKIVQKYEENIKRQKSNEEEQDEIIKNLMLRVSKIDFLHISSKIGGVYKGGKLNLKILGKNFTIDSIGNISTNIHVNSWITIPLLNYILNHNDQKVKGEWVPFRELKKGKAMQGLFNQQCEKPFKIVADTYYDIFEDLIYIFDGKKVDNYYNSDLSLSLLPLPKVPILICYWKSEKGLKSDLKLFFDSTAEEICSIEGVYSLGTGLVRMFQKLAQKHGG